MSHMFTYSEKSRFKRKDYSPLPWSGYFDKFEDVNIPGKKNISFCIVGQLVLV